MFTAITATFIAIFLVTIWAIEVARTGRKEPIEMTLRKTQTEQFYLVGQLPLRAPCCP